MAEKQKARAKGRKIGRHSDRSPSAKAYKAGNRLAINQRKKAKRHARRVAKLLIRKIQWQLRHGKPADTDRLTELRQVISQNH
jgi:hypothetical protein